MRTTMTRAFFTPRSYAAKITPKGIEAEIYLMDGNIAMGFGGKRSKPDFHIRFQTPERRDKHVAEYVESMARRQAEKKKDAAKKKTFAHTLAVGDIMYCSWGYNQTQVDYYQVTKVVGAKSVKIREIGQFVEHEGRGSDQVTAAVDSFKEGSKEMLKRVRAGNVVTIASYANAYPWDGKPKYATAWGYGH